MRINLLTAALFIASLGPCPSATATERYEFFNGVRALGMGGAMVATVNDETALLANPAGLGKLRDYFITILDPEVDVGAQTEQIAGTDILDMRDPQKALDKTNVNLDKRLHGRAQVFPSIVVPNFGFGVFGKYEFNAETVSETNKFEYNYTNDYAAVFGFNFRIWNGIIKLGANARAINRIEVRRDDIDPTSTDLKLDTLASEGMGLASDGGLIITVPTAWLPTLAGVYRDIGDTSYSYRDGMFLNTSERPTTTKGTLDAAIAIHPLLGKRVRSTWTAEFRDAMNVVEEDVKDPMRRFHAGFEINLADALFVRGGWHQRYWTAGFELSMLNYQFQAASYGEEIGTAEQTREDRRYVGKFALRF